METTYVQKFRLNVYDSISIVDMSSTIAEIQTLE